MGDYREDPFDNKPILENELCSICIDSKVIDRKQVFYLVLKTDETAISKEIDKKQYYILAQLIPGDIYLKERLGKDV